MKKFSKFFGIGIIAVILEFIVFSIVARILSNDYLFVATLIGGIVETIAMYILNTKFVWKKRGKKEALGFFGYQAFKVFVLKEIFTWVFGLITPLYQFAFEISSKLHLPFDYDFIESTGIFGFTAVTTMVITYFVCDKLIFSERSSGSFGEKGKISEAGKDRCEEHSEGQRRKEEKE